MVTHDPIAAANVARSAEGQQVLVEITPDRRHFARTLTAVGAAPAGWNGWRRGTGPYSGYDWLENGNNDMWKGIFYGNVMAYAALCDPIVAGNEARCDG